MAPSVSGVRAGEVYVEAGVRDSKLVAGLRSAQSRCEALARSVRGMGRDLMGLGATVGAPFIASSRAFASYEDAMAALRASAQPTADELSRIESAISDIGRETGAGPTQVASAMVELAKAGLSVDRILGGAASSAVKFAKVADLDAATAATTLTDAMNVFGGDTQAAMDTMSRAADASSVSLEQIVMSFQQFSAVADLAGLTIQDTAAAIAILGQNAIKGSDAGTSLKTMMQRLQAPADEGAAAIAELGIQVRRADGSMKSMRSIIAELEGSLGGLNDAARDEAMRRIFGSDAIRAGAVLVKAGARGWDEFVGKMAEGLPVSAKYQILMGTLSGQMERVFSAAQRVAVEVGQAITPTLQAAGDRIIVFASGLSLFVSENKEFTASVFKGALVVGHLGAAVVAASLAMTAASRALAVMLGSVKLFTASISLAGVAVKAFSSSVSAMRSVVSVFSLASGAASLFSSAVSLLPLIFSPLGVIIGVAAASLAGLAYWLIQTGAAGEAVSRLGGYFSGLLETVQVAYKGIADAIMSGDLSLATKIFWAAVETEWNRGIVLVRTAWSDFLSWASARFGPTIRSIAQFAVNSWAAIQTAAVTASGAIATYWVQGSTLMLNAWTTFSTGVMTTWNTTVGLVAGSIAFISTIVQSVAGLIGSAFMTAFSLVGTAIGMLAGAFSAACEAIQAVWTFTVNLLGSLWAGVVGVMTMAWNGSVAVMSAAWGAFAAAFGLAVEGVSAAWTATTALLGGAWTSFVAVAKAAWTGFAKTFEVVAAAIAAVAGVAFGLVTSAVGGLVSVLQTAASWLVKVLGYVGDLIGVNKGIEAFNAAQAAADAKNEKLRDNAEKTRQGRRDAVGAKINAIGEDRERRLDGITDEQRANRDRAANLLSEPGGAKDPAVLEAEAKAGAARAELDRLVKEAADKRKETAETATGEWKPDGKAAESPSERQGGIEQGLDRAARKIDVAGSFNAAAFRGLGVGESVANEQVREQKATNKKLDKIVKNTSVQLRITS